MSRLRILAVLIILGSIGALFNAAFLKLGGFGLCMKIGMPIAFKLMPLNNKVSAYLDFPFPVGITVALTKLRHISARKGGVGGGNIYVDIALDKWDRMLEEENGIKYEPVILIQETQEIDEIQHYKIRLSSIEWSLLRFISWIAGLIGIFGILIGVLWKILMRPPPPNAKLALDSAGSKPS